MGDVHNSPRNRRMLQMYKHAIEESLPMHRSKTIWLTAIALAFAFLALARPQPASAQYGAIATVVNANFLNVRNAPTANGGVVAVIARGYTYEAIGRTADSSWWQLRLEPSGFVGWASGWYLSISNAHAVPIVASPAPSAATFSSGVVNTARLNVRAIPDPINGVVLRTVSEEDFYIIVGRNEGLPRWYQIALNDGTSGWVNGRYLIVANANLAPVTYHGAPGQPPMTFGTVTSYFLNVRTTPNPYIYNIIAIISRNQTYTVIGRNSTSTWWQIRLSNGTIGWVSGAYFAVVNGGSVPITF